MKKGKIDLITDNIKTKEIATPTYTKLIKLDSKTADESMERTRYVGKALTENSKQNEAVMTMEGEVVTEIELLPADYSKNDYKTTLARKMRDKLEKNPDCVILFLDDEQKI